MHMARAFFVAAFFATSADGASAITADFTNGTTLSGGDLLSEVNSTNLGGGLFALVTAENSSGSRRRVAVINTQGGVGAGGTAEDPDLASPFQNVDDFTEFRPFGNALIIQEGNADPPDTPEDLGPVVPDDQAGGGLMTFVFDDFVWIDFVDMLDIEETTSISLFSDVLGSTQIDATVSGKVINKGLTGNGPNQFKRFALDAQGVRRMEIDFGGSGAVGAIGVVPVPLGLPLLASAFGVAALVKRRSRRAA